MIPQPSAQEERTAEARPLAQGTSSTGAKLGHTLVRYASYFRPIETNTMEGFYYPGLHVGWQTKPTDPGHRLLKSMN
eukprot:2687247-Amphidinium_carterae.1